MGRLRCDVQPLTLLYTILAEKGYPFYIPFIEKKCPFHVPTFGSLVLIFMQYLRSAHTMGLFPATRSLNSLHEETGCRDLYPGSVHMKRLVQQVAGTCPKNSNWFQFMRLVTGAKVGPYDQILKKKWSVHTMRLVAGTSHRYWFHRVCRP